MFVVDLLEYLLPHRIGVGVAGYLARLRIWVGVGDALLERGVLPLLPQLTALRDRVGEGDLLAVLVDPILAEVVPDAVGVVPVEQLGLGRQAEVLQADGGPRLLPAPVPGLHPLKGVGRVEALAQLGGVQPPLVEHDLQRVR